MVWNWHLLLVSSGLTIQGIYHCAFNVTQLYYDHRAIHYEKQPHTYAMAWTTNRPQNRKGGNFFSSAYGIRVHGAANSMTIWEPGEHHGTSLQDVDPLDRSPDFIQTGMSIVTSSRIKAVWEKYYEGGMEEILRECGSEEFFDDSDLPDWLK
jgi:hypothetical protein